MSHFCFWECAVEYNATSQAQAGADWTLVETKIRGMAKAGIYSRTYY